MSLGGCEVVREHLKSATRDRTMLYSRVKANEGEVQAQICIIHGLEDHSGRYLTVILLFLYSLLYLEIFSLRNLSLKMGFWSI